MEGTILFILKTMSRAAAAKEDDPLQPGQESAQPGLLSAEIKESKAFINRTDLMEVQKVKTFTQSMNNITVK